MCLLIQTEDGHLAIGRDCATGWTTLPDVSDPCTICGTDSVATCPSCGKRVCNRHMVLEVRSVDPTQMSVFDGSYKSVRLIHPTAESLIPRSENALFGAAFGGGRPRCVTCRERDGRRAVEAAAQRAAEHAADETTEARRVSEALETARDPPQIAQLLAHGAEGVKRSVYLSAWIRLAKSGVLPATTELVELQFYSSWIGGGQWEEISRFPAWCVQDALTSGKRSGVGPSLSARRKVAPHLWVDKSGNAYRALGVAGDSIPLDMPQHVLWSLHDSYRSYASHLPQEMRPVCAVAPGQALAIKRRRNWGYADAKSGHRDRYADTWHWEGAIPLLLSATLSIFEDDWMTAVARVVSASPFAPVSDRAPNCPRCGGTFVMTRAAGPTHCPRCGLTYRELVDERQ